MTPTIELIKNEESDALANYLFDIFCESDIRGVGYTQKTSLSREKFQYIFEYITVIKQSSPWQLTTYPLITQGPRPTLYRRINKKLYLVFVRYEIDTQTVVYLLKNEWNIGDGAA